MNSWVNVPPRSKVSSERPVKRGIDLAIPGFVFWCVFHFTTAPPDTHKNCIFKIVLMGATTNILLMYSEKFLQNIYINVLRKYITSMEFCKALGLTDVSDITFTSF